MTIGSSSNNTVEEVSECICSLSIQVLIACTLGLEILVSAVFLCKCSVVLIPCIVYITSLALLFCSSQIPIF